MNEMSVLWYVTVCGGFMALGLLGSKTQEIKRLKQELAEKEAEPRAHLPEIEAPRICRFPVN